jgi:hypothetical protein
MADWLVAW